MKLTVGVARFKIVGDWFAQAPKDYDFGSFVLVKYIPREVRPSGGFC